MVQLKSNQWLIVMGTTKVSKTLALFTPYPSYESGLIHLYFLITTTHGAIKANFV